MPRFRKTVSGTRLTRTAPYDFTCADMDEYCPGYKTRKTYFNPMSREELCGEKVSGKVCSEMGPPEIATLVLAPALLFFAIFMFIYYRHHV